MLGSKRPLAVVTASFFAVGTALAAQPNTRVAVVDKAFDTAGGMLAYTEFELSGEPMAEALGLDLDVLDPNIVNQPTAFDYAAGIESYEYSEEAMYAVNYQSRMGPHLANGPANAAHGGSLEALGKRFVELSKPVGFPAEELPLNLYPITFPYVGGVPEFGQKVDMAQVSGDEVEVVTAHGKAKKVAVVVPAYFRDFSSLAWREDGMDKAFSPAAAGGEMLKDVMWSQDFLGGMHVIESDEEVEAASSTMDQDGKHALGVSAADGVNGVILTEITWDKLLTLRDRMAYDGKKLGAKLTAKYDPAKGPIWFPHRVEVTEAMKNGVKAIGGLKVADGSSTLRDTWMLLWPLSETYAYMDQREVNKAQNPGFLAVFDGAPFPAAPKVNRNASLADDVEANDPFTAVSTLVNAVFKNLDALHFDAKAGTLVDGWDGERSKSVTTYDAAYALAALQIFQRSQDALPVGYASADAGESIGSQRGKRALAIIKTQADFILNKLVGKNGLVADSYSLGKGASDKQTLGTQFATIRGLSAAFKATGDARYKEAARQLFLAIEKHMFDKVIGAYANIPGQATEHTAWTAAAISSGLRDAMLTLRRQEGETAPQLELANLTQRYESWFRTVINGRNSSEGMQLAEWLGDSGENIVKGDSSGDTDADNVPQVTRAGGKFGTAMTMAGRVSVTADKMAQR